jgi:LmbE family N-acetylglucosaminyl deacetylase
MDFHRPDTDLLVPDGIEPAAALARTTHLCVGAHQDDQEFMAYEGIEACYEREDRWFTGVVVTDGGGSARSGPYAGHTDEQMTAVRREEQRRAAALGKYGCQIQLGYPSREVKDGADPRVVDDLERVFAAARPHTVYLHNPADKHDTHVACCLRAIAALRRLPAADRPARVLGCEIWRDLDWLVDADKTVLEVGGRPELAAALAATFDSQLCGGKRYDLAIRGRWRANATMFESHAVDHSEALSWAIDLTPLVRDEQASVIEHTLAHLDRLRADLTERARRVGGA